MDQITKLEKWFEDELANREFILYLINDLNAQQIGFLLSSIEIENGKNLHKGIAQSKLLLDKARRKLVYKKIRPPFDFLNAINIEEMSKEVLINLLQEKKCNDNQIALTLFLQNYYNDALMYYYESFDRNLITDQSRDTDNKNLELEINRIKKENVNLLKKKEENEKELIRQHLEYERLVGDYKKKLKEKEEVINSYMNRNEVLKQDRNELQKQKTILEKLTRPEEKFSSEMKFMFKFDEKPIKEIVENFPSNAIDIRESLELTKDTLDQTIIAINNKLTYLMTERIFDSSTFLLQLAETVHHYEENINKFIEVLDIESMDEELTNVEVNERNIPNYEAYSIDNEVEYTLYEDFTHKRPHAFKVNNDYKIEVKTWKEMLTKTCELLIAVDTEKFDGFEYNPKMNGKRSKYFTSDKSLLWNPVKVGNVYIETAISANGIRNLIVKMLREYHFKIHEFKVYLRADYTDLHA